MRQRSTGQSSVVQRRGRRTAVASSDVCALLDMHIDVAMSPSK